MKTNINLYINSHLAPCSTLRTYNVFPKSHKIQRYPRYKFARIDIKVAKARRLTRSNTPQSADRAPSQLPLKSYRVADKGR